MRPSKFFVTCIAAAFLSLNVAQAAPLVSAPLPGNAYITQGGLDWAWANPLPSSSGSFDLTFQSAFGWRLPTLAELLSAPLATDFLFPGGNVPFGGTDPVSGATFQATNANYNSDGACAAPYFSNTYSHCDWQDGNGQTFGPWNGLPGANSVADQLVVRSSSTVPEPGTFVLMGLGLVGVGVLRRRKA